MDQSAEYDDKFSRVVPVMRRRRLSEIDEGSEDIKYWLSRTPAERIAAVTFLISQTLKKGERMDKTIVVRRKLHE
ncbi:MAG: hypothetical protein EOP56_15255 [Sphingobacteriales bacterium]|nr:MAG: hypothetical protein EOP56_15255 [Sphingobacteriales bacterium]